MKEVGPDPVDISVGMRVRHKRIALGLSQTTLAESIGVSFQAVQKYERGEIRLSASMLLRIGGVLKEAPNFFFGLNGEGKPDEVHMTETGGSRAAMILAGAYLAIKSPELRASIRKLVVELSERNA